MLTKEQQIDRIKMIMGNPAMKTCLDCGKVYLPMNSLTNHLCPFCQADEIQALESGEELEKELEVISFEDSEV